MNSEKFISQLSQGELGERVIASFFLSQGKFNKVEFKGAGTEYDLKCYSDDKSTTFEIKTDRYEFFKKKQTGNMFLEISCNQKPSGINSSKADFYIYYFPDREEFYLMPLPELRLFLVNQQIHIEQLCGDGNKFEGYLLNREVCKKHFKVYKIKKDIDIWKVQ